MKAILRLTAGRKASLRTASSLFVLFALTACGDTFNNYGAETEADEDSKEVVVKAPDAKEEKPTQTSTGTSVDTARGHASSIVDALSLRLTECRVRRAGDVTVPDLAGVFRFYLEASYADGTTDGPTIFQTNVNNAVASEVSDFLAMIPSRVFRRCKHGPPPADPQAMAAQHTTDVISALNAALSRCTVGIQGSISAPDPHGDFFIYLTAVYDDGTFASPVRFQSNYNDQASAAAARMLRLVPSVEFTRCTRSP